MSPEGRKSDGYGTKNRNEQTTISIDSPSGKVVDAVYEPEQTDPSFNAGNFIVQPNTHLFVHHKKVPVPPKLGQQRQKTHREAIPVAPLVQ